MWLLNISILLLVNVLLLCTSLAIDPCRPLQARSQHLLRPLSCCRSQPCDSQALQNLCALAELINLVSHRVWEYLPSKTQPMLVPDFFGQVLSFASLVAHLRTVNWLRRHPVMIQVIEVKVAAQRNLVILSYFRGQNLGSKPFLALFGRPKLIRERPVRLCELSARSQTRIGSGK
jgi:hypothetical protein